MRHLSNAPSKVNVRGIRQCSAIHERTGEIDGRSRSAKLAKIVASSLANRIEANGSARTTEAAIHDGVFELLFEFVPDDSTAIALGEQANEDPMILALSGSTLYICRCEPRQFQGGQFKPQLTTRWLSPGMGTVTISTQHWRRQGQSSPPREVQWMFSFSRPDEDLLFRTAKEPYEEIDTGKREPLAFALAAAIGCGLDAGASVAVAGSE